MKGWGRPNEFASHLATRKIVKMSCLLQTEAAKLRRKKNLKVKFPSGRCLLVHSAHRLLGNLTSSLRDSQVRID